MEKKTCTKCGAEYPATTEYFGKHSQVKCGLRPSCRVCDRAHDRKRNQTPERKVWFQERENMPERIAFKQEYQRRDYVMEKSRQFTRDRWHNDPEYRAMQAESDKKRRRTPANRAYMNNYRKVWGKTPAGKRSMRLQNVRRRSRIKGIEGFYTSADQLRIYQEQDGRCAYCGISVFDDYHIDHVTPITKSGTNWPENLAVACPECNASKNNRTPQEWEAVRGW